MIQKRLVGEVANGQLQHVTLISGSADEPNSTAGITSGSDCYETAVSGTGDFIAMRCKRKTHPDGSATSTQTKDEGWLYDATAGKLTVFADMLGKEVTKRAMLKTRFTCTTFCHATRCPYLTLYSWPLPSDFL